MERRYLMTKEDIEKLFSNTLKKKLLGKTVDINSFGSCVIKSGCRYTITNIEVYLFERDITYCDGGESIDAYEIKITASTPTGKIRKARLSM
jgi:hypothetical protein